MVPGDHAHPDPGPLTERDCITRFFPRGIDDSDECDQIEILDEVEQINGGIERLRIEVAECNCENPESLASKPVVLS